MPWVVKQLLEGRASKGGGGGGLGVCSPGKYLKLCPAKDKRSSFLSLDYSSEHFLA